MSSLNDFDELEEMSVPVTPDSDDIKVSPRKQKQQKLKPGEKPKSPYQLELEAKQRAARVKMIAVIGGTFVLVLAALILVGMWAGGVFSENITKAEIDTTRGYFLNRQNIPDMEAEGVKGKIKEAYFTKDGDLAVTLNVANGADSEHTITSIDVTIVNDGGQTVAKQYLTEDDFQITYRVPANGRREVYFEIDKDNVLLPEDSLKALGSTLQIQSQGKKTS